MNQASHMLGIQSLAFFHKKLLFFIDNFLFSIKHKTTQNKELKYRRKNIVWQRRQFGSIISKVKKREKSHIPS